VVTRPLKLETRQQQELLPALETDAFPLLRPQRLALIALCLSCCLALLVMAVVMLSQLGATSPLSEMPPAYLPGKPLPDEVVCHTIFTEPRPRCSVKIVEGQLAGIEIFFDYNLATRLITRSIIPAHGYTMGQLYAEWGKPDSIQWSDNMVYVYWDARSVWFNTGVFRPQTRAELILYNMQGPIDAAPWHGFRPLQS